MDVKRYIGSDLTRLFARVERELGPDAVIVRTRTLLRDGGPPLIEVVAAPGPGDADLELASAVTDSIIQRVTAIDPNLTVGELEDIIARESAALEAGQGGQKAEGGEEREALRSSRPEERPSPEPAEAPVPIRLAFEPPSERRPLPEALRASGFTPAAAEVVARLASGASDVQEAVAASLSALEVRFPPEEETALVTMVGGPASGRTSALVRLALDCVDAGRPAVLVAADWERAGAFAQLQAYARALGIRLMDGRDTPALAKAVSRARPGTCFFVDTPVGGWNGTPPGAMVYRYLVVPAHWHPEALRRLVAPHIRGRLAGVALTFVDVATDLSPALSLAFEAGVGIAFLCSGRDVASGVEDADPRALASGIRPGASRERTDGHLAATA